MQLGFGLENRSHLGIAYEARAILNLTVLKYHPTKVFGLFSGGHDSLCSTHVASGDKAFAGAVHINTGIGIEQTREFVRQTCRDLEWPLIEMHPPSYFPGRCSKCRSNRYRPLREQCPDCVAKLKPGIDYANLPAYEAITLHHGFAGPGGHRLMYNRLKERCLRQLLKEHKVNKRDRILLVGGMRMHESSRRMGNAETASLEGCRVWCAPIIYWTKEQRENYINTKLLPRNPVVRDMCMSGECLCGAFAHPGEIKELECFYPQAAAHIHRIEDKAKSLNVHHTWGTKHPNSKKTKQSNNPSPFADGLCFSCNAKQEKIESDNTLQ